MQNSISMSSTEAEYNAVVYLGQELFYVRLLMTDLRLNVPVPMPIFIDNQSTISIVKNPYNMRRTRHIEIKHMKLVEWFDRKLITFTYIPSADNIADIFTKAARVASFRRNCSRLMHEVSPVVDEAALCFALGDRYWAGL